MTSQCEPISLTYDQVKADLEQLVADNPGFIYEQPVNEDACVYFHAGEPSCGVGHVLAKHGITEEQAYLYNFNASAVQQLFDKGGVGLSHGPVLVADRPETIHLLRIFQEEQDSGLVWDDALRDAEAQSTPHSDYPHHPGYLIGCAACQVRCNCTPGNAECVFEGEHNGTAS